MTNRVLDHHPKKQGIIDYFARHRVAANLMMVIIILLGIGSIFKLQTKFFPDIEFNSVSVSVPWQGANAESVEKFITTPIEKVVAQLDGVDKTASRSQAGYANIDVMFKASADLSTAEQKVRQLIESQVDLPENIGKINVHHQIYRESIANILVTTEGSLEELRPFIEDYRSQLLGLGIPQVDVMGLPQYEMKVELSNQTLNELDLDISQIGQLISNQNQEVSAGTAGTGFSTKAIKSNENSTTAAELSNLIIKSNQQGQRLSLADIANIEQRPIEGNVEIFYDQKKAVRLRLLRTKDIDSLQAADIMNQWLEELTPNLPQSINVLVYHDNSEFIRSNLSMLLSNGLIGLVFVTLTLFVLLNAKVALWSAFGIPVAIFGTLILLLYTGGSLNFLTMFGMLMALGIIVDDAIVVGEEAVTQLENGVPPEEAAQLGASRMFGPVLASSLTTIAAFSPLFFIGGVDGELFKPIPMVIICVLAASLIECFIIMPGHLHHSFTKAAKKAEQDKLQNKKESRFHKLRVSIDKKLTNFRQGPYRNFVTKALKHRGLSLSFALSLFVISIALIASGIVQFQYDPDAEDQYIQAYAELTSGTDQARLDDFTKEMERALYAADEKIAPNQELVETYYINQSSGRGYTYLRVTLVPRDERNITNADFLKAWEKEVIRAPYVDLLEISGDSTASAPAKKVSLFLAGDDLSVLKDAAKELKERLKQYPELKNPKDNLPYGQEQWVFELNQQAHNLGLTKPQIAQQIKAAVDGFEAQSLIGAQVQMNLIVSLIDAQKNDLQLLSQLPILTPQGNKVPLYSIVNMHSEKSLQQISHENGQMGVLVSADLIDVETDLAKLSKLVQETEIPYMLAKYGLQSEIRGSSLEMKKTLTNLLIAGISALLLIYIILAWVFSSYSWPFAVMAAIPLGLTGAIFGHLILGFNMSVLSIFGFFGLAGIIVNDSIILISRYRELRQTTNLSINDAIVESSVSRFRAVLLTSLTTVVGLVPILFETSVQAQLVQSMATSLAFGLSYGTLLVLIVIPVILSLIESLKAKFKRKPILATP